MNKALLTAILLSLSASVLASDLHESPKPNPCVAKNWKRTNNEFKDFRGQDLKNVTIANQNLKGANFSGMDLSGVKFSNVDLTWANFTGAKGSGIIMTDACVHQAYLTGFTSPNIAIENVIVSSSKIDKWNIVGGQLVESAIINSKGRIIANGGSWHDMALVSNILTGSSFVGTMINDMPNVRDNDLSNSNINGAKMIEVTVLPGNNFKGVDFGKLAVRNRVLLPN